MSTPRRGLRHEVRAGRRREFRLEFLEDRRLLATSSFTSPSLSGLIAQAWQGKDTSRAAISKMVTALKTQLTSGPLADYTSGGVDGSGLVAEATSMVAGYVQSADSQLLPHFVNIDTILRLQGQKVVADLASLNQQLSVGLITDADFSTQATAAIDALTAGPITALNTPVSAYVSTTETFVNQLETQGQSLLSGSSASTADLTTTFQAAVAAYRADMYAGLLVTHPNIANQVDSALVTLEDSIAAINTTDTSTALSEASAAITKFQTTMLGTTGLFGTNGPVRTVDNRYGYVPINLTVSQSDSTLSGVSASSNFGGTATLTATLLSAAGSPLAGQDVNFLLDGAFVGTAVTDSSGVATLDGVATSDAVGTSSNAVVASFAGAYGHRPIAAAGDLVVSKAATALSSVSGTGTFGGTATLTATLTSTETGGTLAGETVTFKISGTSVGTAVTNSSGVATLSGVTTSLPVGANTGALVASYAGGTNYAAATDASGNVAISAAQTTLSGASATASYGGTATLTATLVSNASNQPVSGATVTFTLDGTSVGTATTNSSGVATLTGVATTDTAGTHTGAVVASFAGNSSYGGAANATGNLVVSQAATALSSVSGTASYGGTATLTATLKSSVTNAAISGATVTFTLDGTSVGTATTDSNGVATLTGVATTDAAGTHTGVVVASYAGDTNYAAATNATGNLVVSQAPTALSSVSGTGSSAPGGKVTLVATLKSSVTSAGVQGQTVDFYLGTGTTPVGSVQTDASGVATLANLDNTGLTNGETVTAKFAGSTNYAAAADATGTLTLVAG